MPTATIRIIPKSESPRFFPMLAETVTSAREKNFCDPQFEEHLALLNKAVDIRGDYIAIITAPYEEEKLRQSLWLAAEIHYKAWEDIEEDRENPMYAVIEQYGRDWLGSMFRSDSSYHRQLVSADQVEKYLTNKIAALQAEEAREAATDVVYDLVETALDQSAANAEKAKTERNHQEKMQALKDLWHSRPTASLPYAGSPFASCSGMSPPCTPRDYMQIRQELQSLALAHHDSSNRLIDSPSSSRSASTSAPTPDGLKQSFSTSTTPRY